MRVQVKPELLRWARERAGLEIGALAGRLPGLPAWELGRSQPTLRQLETFAKATHAPIGYLFLDAPPVETLPIPDFRTMEHRPIDRPSPDLLDTLYLCQQRQEWYRDFARSLGEKPLQFVGSAKVTSDVVKTAADMRHRLGLDLEERRGLPTWTDALRRFIDQADALGVLVMVSGVVGSNNTRKLDPEEFRGFALADGVAPLVFINGSDSKSAQMFSLAHELAHIWLGETGVSNVRPVTYPDNRIEKWCNAVAAELLVPIEVLRNEYDRGTPPLDEAGRLARRFKVSALVVLRRMHDAGGLTRERMWELYFDELARLKAIKKGDGGNFYLTQAARVSKRFARALVVNTLEGLTLYTDAFRLLGFSKLATFRQLGSSLGVL
ncbi:MAG: ImmA/IrrE family metallo-endopeptidase [Planctomycetia bacterium]|nr:ImmA/IrrE family metallo-endopeptidase [Planctomycetia bacterium]